jgi:hypothetical protein
MRQGAADVQDIKPSWQSTVIALALITLVGGIFIVVYEKDGIDAGLKAWGAIGTLVGVVAGAVPTYFFGRVSAAAAQEQLQSAVKQATHERQRRDTAEDKASVVLGLAEPSLLESARSARPDLFGPAGG